MSDGFHFSSLLLNTYYVLIIDDVGAENHHVQKRCDSWILAIGLHSQTYCYSAVPELEKDLSAPTISARGGKGPWFVCISLNQLQLSRAVLSSWCSDHALAKILLGGGWLVWALALNWQKKMLHRQDICDCDMTFNDKKSHQHNLQFSVYRLLAQRMLVVLFAVVVGIVKKVTCR